MAVAVVDTSVFIAREAGRPVGPLPDTWAVSVVTLAELELGVLLAAPEAVGKRLGTLSAVREHASALPIDENVASAFASLVAALARAQRKAAVQDAWIAATAIAHGVPVCSQDADFDGMPGVEVLRV